MSKNHENRYRISEGRPPIVTLAGATIVALTLLVACGETNSPISSVSNTEAPARTTTAAPLPIGTTNTASVSTLDIESILNRSNLDVHIINPDGTPVKEKKTGNVALYARVALVKTASVSMVCTASHVLPPLEEKKLRYQFINLYTNFPVSSPALKDFTLKNPPTLNNIPTLQDPVENQVMSTLLDGIKCVKSSINSSFGTPIASSLNVGSQVFALNNDRKEVALTVVGRNLNGAIVLSVDKNAGVGEGTSGESFIDKNGEAIGLMSGGITRPDISTLYIIMQSLVGLF